MSIAIVLQITCDHARAISWRISGDASCSNPAPVLVMARCIAICSELYYPAPDRKTSCGAAAWNGPSKQCYLKTHKSKPMAKKGDVSFVLNVSAK
jgi:hypothetical protein